LTTSPESRSSPGGAFLQISGEVVNGKNVSVFAVDNFS